MRENVDVLHDDDDDNLENALLYSIKNTPILYYGRFRIIQFTRITQ